IVKMFSDFFQSVFNPTSKSPDCSKRVGNYNSNITLSPVDDLKVLRVLKKLKSDGIRGPDQIPAFFITQYAEFLSKPLAIIFNLCIKHGTFPDRWKISKIIPIFKSKDRCHIENYRSVSILNNISKVFETLIY